MQIKITFRTRNNTKHGKTATTNKYEKNDVYQKKCMDCPLKYTKQTGRTFYTRYKAHIQAIRNNNVNSEYSNHILNIGHAYRSITDKTKIIRTEKKGKHLHVLENHKNIEKGKTSRYIRKMPYI
jgi:hypothetical protein